MSAIHATLDALRVDVKSLNPYYRNPRRGDVATIIKSLKRIGQYRPLVVNRGSLTDRPSEVLAGNHTLMAVIALGWSEIAVTWVDVDDETAARIVAVDNRVADLGDYDNDALGQLLGSLPDLEGTGYSAADLEELLAEAGQTPGKTTEPDEGPKKPRSKRGDLFILGHHRLLCGDSTSRDVVRRALDGDRPGLLFTDPAADALDALALASEFTAPGAGWYVWCTWRTYPVVLAALDAAGQSPAACIVWRKARSGGGQYGSEHEFCVFCHPELDGDHELCVYCAGDEWRGHRGASDIWETPEATVRPTVLAERAIENSSRPGAIVFDPFGDTGTTLIASENLNRKARLIEIRPAAVDTIVDRWERHTGQKARLA